MVVGQGTPTYACSSPLLTCTAPITSSLAHVSNCTWGAPVFRHGYCSSCTRTQNTLLKPEKCILLFHLMVRLLSMCHICSFIHICKHLFARMLSWIINLGSHCPGGNRCATYAMGLCPPQHVLQARDPLNFHPCVQLLCPYSYSW